jgi:hypothetical protein
MLMEGVITSLCRLRAVPLISPSAVGALQCDLMSNRIQGIVELKPTAPLSLHSLPRSPLLRCLDATHAAATLQVPTTTTTTTTSAPPPTAGGVSVLRTGPPRANSLRALLAASAAQDRKVSFLGDATSSLGDANLSLG